MKLNPIGDLEQYNRRMALSAMDKMFFVDKIEAEAVLDYGCADGSLLTHIRQWLPEATLVGFDHDPKMINQETLLKLAAHNIQATTKWANAVDLCRTKMKVAVLLSSVLHEIYHYNSPQAIAEFWNSIFTADFKYVIIRDMMPSRSIDRPSAPQDVACVHRTFGGTNVLSDFEKCWGSIESNKNLIHFLLKYGYSQPQANWEREVRENYFPLCREDLYREITKEYEVIYQEHFVLPYVFRKVRTDTGISIKDPTHLKIILEKR